MNFEAVLTPNLSILLVSSNQNNLTTLQKSIHSTWKEQSENLRQYQSCNIHIAQSLEPFLQYQNTDRKLHIDFIVFLIDPSIMISLQETESNLKKLFNLFGRQRICLVALDLNYSSVVTPVEMRTFSKVYQISLLIGSIKKDDDCRHLSEQILNLCEITSGMINGIPAIRKI